eukprot:TRINITY_DN5712_c0_g1_i1.p1 TRINITY_DN5712_c0_g1~~TRINITY_DN5712_c0_g1_i1.p1  ORF type:complete len:243 (+),score=32.66 TRINITY_DN5712_c0_g1_i1:117-845(+)
MSVFDGLFRLNLSPVIFLWVIISIYITQPNSKLVDEFGLDWRGTWKSLAAPFVHKTPASVIFSAASLILVHISTVMQFSDLWLVMMTITLVFMTNTVTILIDHYLLKPKSKFKCHPYVGFSGVGFGLLTVVLVQNHGWLDVLLFIPYKLIPIITIAFSTKDTIVGHISGILSGYFIAIFITNWIRFAVLLAILEAVQITGLANVIDSIRVLISGKQVEAPPSPARYTPSRLKASLEATFAKA